MDFTIAIPFIAGGIRNLSGWFETSLKDGVISTYEWSALGKTVIEVAVLAFGAIYGLNLDVVQASSLAVVASVLISKFKR